MTTKVPSLLLPNVRDPQTEAAWKSIKAVTDYQASAMNNVVTATSTNISSLRSEVAALAAQVAALTAAVAALTNTTFTATMPIVQGQVLYSTGGNTVGVASSAIEQQATSLVGIAAASALTGGTLKVYGPGEIATGFSGLTVGPVYLGPGGTIVQTPPVAPSFVSYLGQAVSSTSILVQLQGPQQVFETQTPPINYPAIAFANSGYDNLYLLQVNA